MGKGRSSPLAGLGALFGMRPVPEAGLLSGGAASRESLGRDSIRLLTWNVHKQVDPTWRRDFDTLLDRLRPDIVHLQEARVDAMLEAFAGRPEAWSWLASPNLSLGAPAGAVAVGAFTAARAPLLQGAAMLSESSEPLLGTRKPMLRCSLPVLGAPAPVLSLNIHALNFSLGLAGFEAQLDALLAGVNDHDGPVIFSGDFNTWNRWRMDRMLGMLEAAGLRRVDFGAQGPARPWLSARSLDHVFYSHGHFQVKPSSALRFDSIRSSDHAPLLVDFVR